MNRREALLASVGATVASACPGATAEAVDGNRPLLIKIRVGPPMPPDQVASITERLKRHLQGSALDGVPIVVCCNNADIEIIEDPRA